MLAYHGVSSDLPWPIALPSSVLDEQLSFFKRHGYVGLTFAQRERLGAAGELPPKSVVITFDDGCSSTLNAVPILRRLGYPGSVFPKLSFVDSGQSLTWPAFPDDPIKTLSWEQLADLAEEGWEVGSHAVTHPRLSELDDLSLQSELIESRIAIESKLGSCETISYPYGNADSRVAAAAEDAGYLAGCTLSDIHLVDEPFLRPRVGMSIEDTGLRLRMKVSRAAEAFRRSSFAARLSGPGRAELARMAGPAIARSTADAQGREARHASAGSSAQRGHPSS